HQSLASCRWHRKLPLRRANSVDHKSTGQCTTSQLPGRAWKADSSPAGEWLRVRRLKARIVRNPSGVSAMKRSLFLIYGTASYLLFLAVYVYMAGFVGNFLTPTQIDSANPGPAPLAIVVDLALMGLFAIQHSVMARPAFKRIWTKIVPSAI